MSRRTPNPAAERAAKNAQTIKSLLKLEENKMCADCKRNKHPRWASWNIGVFICIRCSGIHRGMGTHISRVKSVDLDAWTDEQLQNILKWGNLKANKYWESKLAADHLPSESKIENFIRTKYESKRWVMEGPIPDPSTLSVDGDDDLPLSLVKEKQSRERSDAQKAKSSLSEDTSQNHRIQQPDLFKNDNSIYTSEGLTNSSPSRISQNADSASSKQTKPVDTLLGLDFFGTGNALPCRSSSATSTTGVQSRPDLKQSILSLYAAAPRPPKQQTINPQGTFGSVKSSTQKINVENVSNAFESLSFSSPRQSAQNQSSFVFTDLGNISSQKNNLSHVSPPVGKGSFFENKSASKSVPQPTSSPTRSFSSSSGFGAFNSPPVSSATMSTTNSSALGNILDFAPAAPLALETISNISSPSIQQTSVFNLSESSSQRIPISPPKSVSILANKDAWGSNDTWANTGKGSPIKQQVSLQSSIEESGWGTLSGSSINNSGTLQGGESGIGAREANANPIVSSDEEFGSWGSASVATSAATPVANTAFNKPAAGFAGNDDLFSNVWG